MNDKSLKIEESQRYLPHWNCRQLQSGTPKKKKKKKAQSETLLGKKISERFMLGMWQPTSCAQKDPLCPWHVEGDPQLRDGQYSSSAFRNVEI